MPATAWLRNYSVELAWGAFAAANFVAMMAFPSWETIPFHFVWISLTLVYGFRVWNRWPTALILGAVVVTTGASISTDAFEGSQLWGELFEVPLMAAMFLAMVWHAQRRAAAVRRGGSTRRTAGALPARRLPRAAHTGDDRARPSRVARAARPGVTGAHCRARRAGRESNGSSPGCCCLRRPASRGSSRSLRSTSRRSSRTSSSAGPRLHRAGGFSAR